MYIILVKRLSGKTQHDTALIQNKGLIVADGGSVYLTAKGKDALLNTMINNEGVIRARSIGSKNGVIHIDGDDGDAPHASLPVADALTEPRRERAVGLMPPP